MINFIECARRAMKEAHKKEIAGLKESIKKQQKQLADFEQMDIDNEKLSDADFVNKYPDKIQRQKDKYGEN